MLMDIVVYAVLIGLSILFLVLLVNGSLSSRGGGSGVSLTAFHDFQPKDRQNAVEVIVLEKAGKQHESQKSGQGNTGVSPRGETEEKK